MDKKPLIRKGLAVGIILLLCNIISSNFIVAEENHSINKRTSLLLQYWIPHTPIFIGGNQALTSRNGVIDGNGTKDNPFIISGWKIDGKFQNLLDSLRNKFKLLGIICTLLFKNLFRDTSVSIFIKNTDKFIVIRNNYLLNWKEGEIPIAAIYLQNTKNITIENNVIDSCDSGIVFVDGNTYTVIRNNTLKNIDAYTIIGDGGLIENNSLEKCDIAIKCSNSDIQYNLVQSSTIGIATWGPCNISHNDLIGNDIGIGCYWPPHNCIIFGNIIQGNTYSGIYCIGGSQAHIHYNNIFQNNAGVIYSSRVVLNATLNWWGAENGPSGMGAGNGDSVSENVDYIPWLTSPNLDAGR